MIKIIASFFVKLDNEEGEEVFKISRLENEQYLVEYWDEDGILNVESMNAKRLFSKWDFTMEQRANLQI